jgi:hypothetical protein
MFRVITSHESTDRRNRGQEGKEKTDKQWRFSMHEM